MFLQFFRRRFARTVQLGPLMTHYNIRAVGLANSSTSAIFRSTVRVQVLTHTVPPEVPQAAAASAPQDVHVTLGAAAGVFVAVAWRGGATGEQRPQTGTAGTCVRHLLLQLTRVTKLQSSTVVSQHRPRTKVFTPSTEDKDK